MPDRDLNCRDVRRLLAYLGTLEDESHLSEYDDLEAHILWDELRSHLDRCPSCREALSEDLALIQSIRQLRQFSPPGIAATAVRIARRRLLVRSLLRWGVVVVVVSLASTVLEHQIAMVFRGLLEVLRPLGGVFDLRLLTGLISALRTVVGALGKIVAVGRIGGEIVNRQAVYGIMLAGIVVVISIMYGFQALLRGRKEAGS